MAALCNMRRMRSLEEALQLIHPTQTRTALVKYDQSRRTKCLRANRIAYADEMSCAIWLYEHSVHEVACRVTEYTWSKLCGYRRFLEEDQSWWAFELGTTYPHVESPPGWALDPSFYIKLLYAHAQFSPGAESKPSHVPTWTRLSRIMRCGRIAVRIQNFLACGSRLVLAPMRCSSIAFLPDTHLSRHDELNTYLKGHRSVEHTNRRDKIASLYACEAEWASTSAITMRGKAPLFA